MFFLTPRYLKHAKLLRKGVTRFIDYKRDILPPAKLDEICGLRAELDKAIKSKDRARLETLHQEINKVCEKALPDAAPSELADNVEVFFVAIVIALGIRAYIAQPFQIPTGSMQPTLNGITAVATAEPPSPGVLGWLGSFFTSTRFIDVVSDHTGTLANPALTEHKFLIFMPYCKLHFTDGHTITINAPKTQLLDELQLAEHLRSEPIRTGNDTPDGRYVNYLPSGLQVTQGQVLARGYVKNGDHVLVDKFSYHFRSPRRGEVFVFTTSHIAKISVPPEQGSQHYIKRLAGVPGDHLEVKEPELWVNGAPASESGFKRVMTGTFAKPADGYRGYADAMRIGGLTLNEITLSKDRYFALGDNSFQSSDSRYWGHVPDRNLVGPALFCYWPLGKHWGSIK